VSGIGQDIYLRYKSKTDFWLNRVSEVCSDCSEGCFIDSEGVDYSHLFTDSCLENMCSIFPISECVNIKGCLQMARVCTADACRYQEPGKCSYPCVKNEEGSSCVADLRCAQYTADFCLRQKENYCRLENEMFCVPDPVDLNEDGCRIRYMKDVVH
jgi:hypothetical protein